MRCCGPTGLSQSWGSPRDDIVILDAVDPLGYRKVGARPEMTLSFEMLWTHWAIAQLGLVQRWHCHLRCCGPTGLSQSLGSLRDDIVIYFLFVKTTQSLFNFCNDNLVVIPSFVKQHLLRWLQFFTPQRLNRTPYIRTTCVPHDVRLRTTCAPLHPVLTTGTSVPLLSHFAVSHHVLATGDFCTSTDSLHHGPDFQKGSVMPQHNW